MGLGALLVAGGIGAGVAGYAAVGQIAIVIAGVYEARRQQKKGRDAYNAALEDKTRIFKGSDAPWRLAFGETLLSGPLTYWVSHGDQKRFLSVVVTLAGHECHGIPDVYFDGKSIGPLDGEGYVIGGKYKQQLPKPLIEKKTAPAAGGVITLGRTPTNLDTIAIQRNDGASVVMEPFFDYTLIGADIRMNSDKYEGDELIITYQYNAGHPLVRVQKFLGSPAGERDTYLEGVSEGVWESTAVGKNICRIRVDIEYDDKTFGGKMPDIAAIVQGVKCYDPRDAQTKYTRNPALIIRHYLLWEDGFACDVSEINDASFIAAANVCDEQIETSLGVFNPRYTCDGAIDTSVSPRANLEALLTSCVGTAVYSGGAWSLLPATYRTPVMTLTDDDLASGDGLTQAFSPIGSLFNCVRGQHINPDQGFALDDFPPYVSSTFIAEDGGQQFWSDFDFPFCRDAVTAQRMARLKLFDHRQAVVDTDYYKMRALALQPGDTVWRTSAINGWTNKVFKVVNRMFDAENMRVRLTLKEDAPEVYDEDYNEWLNPDPAPNTELPDPSYVEPIANYSAASNGTTFEVGADGVVRSYVLLTWDAVTGSDVLLGGHIRVIWKRAAEGLFRELKIRPDATEAKIQGVSAGDILNIQVTAVNGINVESLPVVDIHRVSRSLITDGKAAYGENMLPATTFFVSTNGWVKTNGAFNPPSSASNGLLDRRVRDESASIDANIMVINATNLNHLGEITLSGPVLLDPTRSYFFQSFVQSAYFHARIGVALYDQNGSHQETIWNWSDDENGDRVIQAREIAEKFSEVDDITKYDLAKGVVSASVVSKYSKTIARFVIGFDFAPPEYSGSLTNLQTLSIHKPMLTPTALESTAETQSINIEWKPSGSDDRNPLTLSSGAVISNFVADSRSAYPVQLLENNPSSGFNEVIFIPSALFASKVIVSGQCGVAITQTAGQRSQAILELSLDVNDAAADKTITIPLSAGWGQTGGVVHTDQAPFSHTFSISGIEGSIAIRAAAYKLNAQRVDVTDFDMRAEVIR